MERMKPTAYKIGEGERKGLSKDMQEVIGALEEENKKLKEKYNGLTMYPQNMKELKEENIKLKEFINITVQTKNEKIRNLLEELEYYKKQCGED